ncbi:MAG: addiction module protein, partial [Candidatus Binatia bacterium]
MIRNSAKVVSDALSLPPRSRAKLAEQLLESLDDPKQKEIDRLWADEVEDRIDA